MQSWKNQRSKRQVGSKDLSSQPRMRCSWVRFSASPLPVTHSSSNQRLGIDLDHFDASCRYDGDCRWHLRCDHTRQFHNGVATLCVTAIRQYRKKSEEEILQNPALSQPYVNNMRDLTQNQTASKSINTLDRARINTYNQKFVGIFPKTALYQDKDSTIKSFKKRTFNLYAGAREMMLDVINAGVQGSFKDAIAKLPQNDNRLDDHRRIALLIIGYFFAKDWNAKELTDQVGSIQRRLDTAQSLPSAQTQLGQGNISRLQRELQSANSKIVAPQNAPAPSPTSLKQWDGQLQAGTVNIGRGASSALELARSVASKKLGGFSTMGLAEGEQRDTQMMSTIQPKAAAYFRAMKAAMVGDVETVLTKTYSGSTLSSEEYKKIWYLYVGSQLILNDSFRQLKVHANTNSFGSLFRKISSVNTISISKQHVDMIRKAGFIHDYNKGISLSQDQKKAFASGAVTGAKLRWSSNPSNTEQAMLLAFCTIVVYTMDVGAITLGMYNWKETKKILEKHASGSRGQLSIIRGLSFGRREHMSILDQASMTRCAPMDVVSG